MAKRLRVVLHLEGVLPGLWGGDEEADEFDALDLARENITEDFTGLVEDLLGGIGFYDITKLVESAEWVEVDG